VNNLTTDSIAIDANVFMHLMDYRIKDKHVYVLLNRLAKDKILLLIDDMKKIFNEYNRHILPRLQKMDEGFPTRILLVHWLLPDNHKIVSINMTGELMTSITKIIPSQKGPDRFYVYVALHEGRVLVTNDTKDILNKRVKLLKIKVHPRLPHGAKILSSEQAHNRL